MKLDPNDIGRIVYPVAKWERLAVRHRWLGAAFVVGVVFLVMLGMAWARVE